MSWNVLTDFEIDYRYANGVELNYKVNGNHVYVLFEGDEGWVKSLVHGHIPTQKAPLVEASGPPRYWVRPRQGAGPACRMDRTRRNFIPLCQEPRAHHARRDAEFRPPHLLVGASSGTSIQLGSA
jgi:hypothetical protein